MKANAKTATITEAEADVLMQLICTYIADRDEEAERLTGERYRDRALGGVCPPEARRHLASAMRKIERLSGNDGDYWPIEECTVGDPLDQRSRR